MRDVPPRHSSGRSRPAATSPICDRLESRHLLAAVGVAFDTAYGAGGFNVTDLADGTLSSENLVDAALAPDGGTRLVGSGNPGMVVLGLTPQGGRDPSYGAAGVATFKANDLDVASDAAQLPDGRLLVSGWAIHYTGSSSPPQRGLLVRFTADGHLDTTFGAGGTDAAEMPVAAATGVTFLPSVRVAAIRLPAD